MKTLLFTGILLVFSISICTAQEKKEEKTKKEKNKKELTKDSKKSKQASDTVKVVIEDLPTFQGGNIKDFEIWVNKNKKYPEVATDMGIEGKVYIMFFVEPDGSLSNINIMRGVDPALDNEAINVVKKAPKWEYKNQRGEKPKPRFTVVVDFKLDK